MSDPFENQRHLSAKNLGNLLLLVLVMLPSVWLTAVAFAVNPAQISPLQVVPPLADWLTLETWAALALHHPLIYVNLLFFVNVCLLFWIINLVQRSTWLIDPYWTLLPLFIAGYFAWHPLAKQDSLRSLVTLLLLGLWSVRLTWNYFRREQWKFGVREDWRFAKKRRESGHFWWISFFYAYFSQQIMLVGLMLPYYAIFNSAAPFGVLDAIFCVAGLVGLLIAHSADTTLFNFVEANRARIARGEKRELLLDSGLWRYSRHPNYFGEQLWWWSIAVVGALLGHPWVLIGTLINSIVLAVVTLMTEKRIRQTPGRAELYDAYCRRTSILIPWFNRRGGS